MFAGGVILPCLVATVYKRNVYHTKTPRLLRKRWGVPNFCQDWGGSSGIRWAITLERRAISGFCELAAPGNRPDRCAGQYVYDLSTNREQWEFPASLLARVVLPGRLRLPPRQIVKGAQRPVLLPLEGEADAGRMGRLQGIPRHILRREPAHV